MEDTIFQYYMNRSVRGLRGYYFRRTDDQKVLHQYVIYTNDDLKSTLKLKDNYSIDYLHYLTHYAD